MRNLLDMFPLAGLLLGLMISTAIFLVLLLAYGLLAGFVHRRGMPVPDWVFWTLLIVTQLGIEVTLDLPSIVLAFLRPFLAFFTFLF